MLSSGATYFDANWNIESETQGKLVKISNGDIVSSFSSELGNHPKGLMINESRDILYFSNGKASPITTQRTPNFRFFKRHVSF